MTGAWVQENLHSILCELANANLTLTAGKSFPSCVCGVEIKTEW